MSQIVSITFDKDYFTLVISTVFYNGIILHGFQFST